MFSMGAKERDLNSYPIAELDVWPVFPHRLRIRFSLPGARPEIADQLRQAKIFVIMCSSPFKVRFEPNDFLGLSLRSAVNLLSYPQVMKSFKKRGSKESCKRFTIASNLSNLCKTVKGIQIGQSKKFLSLDDISYLKLAEEPDVVICESEERQKLYAYFNIPSITFFELMAAIHNVVWSNPPFQGKNIFVEGTFHHAFKTRFAEQFGLKYVSLKTLKKEGLIS